MNNVTETGIVDGKIFNISSVNDDFEYSSRPTLNVFAILYFNCKKYHIRLSVLCDFAALSTSSSVEFRRNRA